MIENDNVDASLFQRRDFRQRRRAAIDCDQELGVMLLATTLDAFPTQPVPLLHSQRQEQLGGCAVASEHFSQERQGGYPVDVVIAEEDDSLPAVDCC